MKKEKIKERNGFKLKEKVTHKSKIGDRLRTYGQCIIVEFDRNFEDTVLIKVPTYSEYNEDDGYEAYVNINELVHGWKESY